jgi:regulatory protein
VRIDSVERGAAAAVKVTVAGGSSFIFKARYAEASGFEAAGLEVGSLAEGQELDEAALAALCLAAEATEAEKRALALLTRAEQCRSLLEAKLEKRGLKARAARLALDRLEAEGLLSDRRYAEAWLRGRDPSDGPMKLLLGLRARGIDSKIAAEALAAVLDPETRRLALEKALRRELSRAKGDRDETRVRLKGLGFRSEEIREAFEN